MCFLGDFAPLELRSTSQAALLLVEHKDKATPSGPGSTVPAAPLPFEILQSDARRRGDFHQPRMQGLLSPWRKTLVTHS